MQRIFMINHPSTGYGKKRKKIRMKENGNHVAAMMKIGEWQCVVELLALFAYLSCLADKIGNKKSTLKINQTDSVHVNQR